MGDKVVATNRKAFHEYHIIEKFEAGVELLGSEVKSLREGKANLKESYVTFRNSDAFVVGMHVSAYSHTGFTGHEPLRARRLLMHSRQLLKLKSQLAERGLTLIPLRLYFKNSWAKLEIGLAKGKKHYDKKESIKQRDIKRDTEREMEKY
ncbi:SsrA-binding protein SmpB [Candidatus Neomarinimicrobiota bacterium]